MTFFWENPRTKRWVLDLLEHKEALSRALRTPLGAMLGCGHWGCVFDSKGPWVVKLTIDPNEAPVWRRITQLIDSDPAWSGSGIVRVKGIYQLDPGIPYGGRMRKAYAIIREAVEPVFKDTRDGLELTPTTKRKLLLGQKKRIFLRTGRLSVDPKTQKSFYRVEHFVRMMTNLGTYRLRVDRHDYDGARRIAEVMSDHLGETLMMLASNGLFLHDVHLLNIGWRKHSNISGFGYEDKAMVIFDPGHTPVGRDPGIPTVKRF